jgi:glycerophosphoryl diester phosphodiesterase
VGHPYFDIPTPIVIGHRGCAGEVPENTLASFERALADGAAILESDVHLTRDGVPVLIHDAEVDRVSDGAGRVADHTLESLRRLDAGHRFSLDGGRSHPFRGRGLRIPTLEEALARFPGARFNLELKAVDAPEVVERSVEQIAHAGRAPLTLLTAGDDGLMARLRAHLARSRVPVAQGACTADVLDFVRTAQTGSAPAAGPMALQIPAEFAGRPLVTPALVAHAHAHGVQVHVWTINEPDEMARLLGIGVDGIVTDHPARLAALLRERARAHA